MAKLVKKGWQQKCSRRLSGVVCKMFTTKGYRAKWSHPSIRKRLAATRATDTFKKRSAQCSLNRRRPGKDMPIHCQGSKSTEQISIELLLLFCCCVLLFCYCNAVGAELISKGERSTLQMMLLLL